MPSRAQTRSGRRATLKILNTALVTLKVKVKVKVKVGEVSDEALVRLVGYTTPHPLRGLLAI